jgi:predicted Rossmann-fold nucleotide-binding protein
MPLLVSGDGYLDRLEVSHGVEDEHGIIHIPARIKLPEAQWGDFAEEGLRPHMQKLQWSTASGKARWAFDVEAIHHDGIEIKENGEATKVATIPATMRFWNGQNRSGESAENPLPDLIAQWMKKTRIHCMRVFAEPAANSHFSGTDVQAAHELEWVKYHPGAKVLPDGRILLPFNNVNFPVRFDSNVLRVDALREAITVGRGAIDTLQQPIKLSLGDIPPHAYRIGATQFSILTGLRAVIDRNVVDRHTHQPTGVKHGTSVLWDGGRTAGLATEHQRHLEVENTSNAPVNSSSLAVAVRIYDSAKSENLPKSVYSLPAESVHRAGINVDHFLGAAENSNALRAAFSRLDRLDDAFGLVVGPKGIRLIQSECTGEYQDQAVIAASEAAMRADFSSNEKWDELKDLQAYLGHVSDYRQRAMLFTRQAPSADALSAIMKLGLRGACTPNVAGNADQIYLDEALLQQYSVLMKKGFGLYLLTPDKIRKLYHQLFVDVKALDRVSKADFRIGGYAASAAGAESVMKRGKLEEMLAMIKQDYPNAAMVTGASESGGMGYLNRTAAEAGLVTIGVASKIPGQEQANDSYDAVMFHGRYDFVTRQGHISRMIGMPIVSIGAEGSNFEEALQRGDLKIGLGAFAPISYVDPVGLGPNNEHMWKDPITSLQRTFTQTHYRTDEAFTLSRSPYVGSMLHFTKSYVDAYRLSQPFFEDPVKYLRGRGVPDRMIALAVDSMVQDAEFTGLPIHAFWKEAIHKWGK